MKTMGPNTRNLLINIFSFLIIIMFTYVVASKLMDIKEFRGSLDNQPFNNKYTSFLVVALPASELLVIALLLFKKSQFHGFLLSTFLMLVFTGYIALVLGRFYDRVPCSCGGITSKLSWNQHLFFNVFFIILSASGALLTWKNRFRGPFYKFLSAPYSHPHNKSATSVAPRKT